MECTNEVNVDNNSYKRRWWTLLAVSLASGLVWLSATDVIIVLPAMAKELNSSLNTLQWLVIAFSLAGVVVVAGGRLTDIYGKRRILLIGTFMFALSSLIAGYSSSVILIIICRAFMGLGAAFILPASLAIVSSSFIGGQRSLALSIWIAVIWLGQSIGPTQGGLYESLGNWRWIFWDNVPLSAIAAVIVLWSMKGSNSIDKKVVKHIDFGGLITLSVSLLAFMFALTLGNSYGWTSMTTLGILSIAIILGALFIIIELKHPEPLIELSLFAKRDLLGGNLVNLVCNFSFSAVLYFMALYMQSILLFSGFKTGLLLLPLTLSILIIAPLGGLVSHHFSLRWPTAIGMGLISVGMYLLFFANASSTYMDLLPGFIIMGAGLGLMITAVTQASLDPAPPEQAGVASGIFKAGSMLGGSLGVAVTMSVFDYYGALKQNALIKPNVIFNGLGGSAEKVEAFIYGYKYAMGISILFAILSIIIAIVLIKRVGSQSTNGGH